VYTCATRHVLGRGSRSARPADTLCCEVPSLSPSQSNVGTEALRRLACVDCRAGSEGCRFLALGGCRAYLCSTEGELTSSLEADLVAAEVPEFEAAANSRSQRSVPLCADRFWGAALLGHQTLDGCRAYLCIDLCIVFCGMRPKCAPSVPLRECFSRHV